MSKIWWCGPTPDHGYSCAPQIRNAELSAGHHGCRGSNLNHCLCKEIEKLCAYTVFLRMERTMAPSTASGTTATLQLGLQLQRQYRNENSKPD